MTYQQLADSLYPNGDIGAEAVKYALKSRGYKRYVALRKWRSAGQIVFSARMPAALHHVPGARVLPNVLVQLNL
jgi:hypothetical protein